MEMYQCLLVCGKVVAKKIRVVARTLLDEVVKIICVVAIVFRVDPVMLLGVVANVFLVVARMF